MTKFVLVFFLFPLCLFAQTPNYPYKAQTLADEVQVYRDANFDSPVIATLPSGKTYDISYKKFNEAFYRVRIKPGVLGYVSDADVKPLFHTGEKKKMAEAKNRRKPEKPPEKIEKLEKKDKAEKRKLPFQFTQYAGFQYAMIQFQEDTMGDKRHEDLGFMGAKISGPNLVIEGAMPTEMNFLFHYGAPSYYEKLTGHTADGWILLMDFLFQNYYPQGKNTLTFFGFGPVMKYSKFNTSLTEASTGKTSDYSMEDISLGAVFNAGVAVRLNNMALRTELQYYWEKQAYLGLSLALQFAF